jgi:serine/threonine protein kinase/Tfp pilus assembly protein PilF
MPVETPSLDTVFCAAIEIATSEERAAYLDRACGADVQFQAQVRKLVDAHFRAGDFLDRPAEGVHDTNDAPPPDVAPGTVIGPYKLLEEIGEGGFGVVFLAEQTEPVRRKVALKILKPGMDTRQVVARFEAERQALAIMDHPNIARVFDAGTTTSGRPYFVLELVKGTPITEFCDVNHLAPRQRLELFAAVCQAVQHAHQKGIIHRDLKPSNVLVSRHDMTPIVKVIDFGVAKALGQELTEKTLFTGIAQMIGTPLYMSPEQAGMSDLDVDTRSDIYSLGVLLYELLTGTTPFTKERFKKVAFDEIRRIIHEEEPPTPSTRLAGSKDSLPSISAQRDIEPARLTKLVRGELDWITMKCLEKDRNRRYATADELAAEVHRYLHDEPVQACPPTARYRLRKFLRKYRGPVTAAGVIAALLVVGVVGTSLGFVRAERLRQLAEAKESEARESAGAEEQAKRSEAAQRQKAEAARRQAMDALRATTDDVVERLIGEKPSLGPTEKAFLEATARRWQAFASEEGDGEQARAVRAEGAHRVAVLRAKLGQSAEAEVGYREAIRLGEKLAADFPTSPEYRLNSARGHIDLGALLSGAGKAAEAEASTRRALAILEPLAAEPHAPPECRLNLARGQIQLGSLLRNSRPIRAAESGAAYWRALADLEPLVGKFPAVPQYRAQLAVCCSELGLLFYQAGPGAQAEAPQRQALAIREALVLEFPDVPEHRHKLARNLIDLGILLKGAEKASAFRRAATLLERLAAENPAVPEYRSDLAWSDFSLANVLQDLGNLAESEAINRRALAIWETLTADCPTVPEYRRGLAAGNIILAHLLFKSRRDAEANKAYRRAIAVLERLVEEFPTVRQYRLTLAMNHRDMGYLFQKLGKHVEAAAEFREAGHLEPNAAAAHNDLGAALATKGQTDEAIAEYREALRLKPADTLARINLGVALDHKGRTDEAIAEYREALRLKPNFPPAHNNLGVALWNKGRQDEAIAELREATRLNPNLAAAHGSLGRCLLAMGQLEEAVTELGQAARLEPDNAAAQNNLAWILATCEEPMIRDSKRAIEIATKAVELVPNSGAYWNTLGVARYYTGDHRGAIDALTKSMELNKGGGGVGWFFLAMAHWKLGDKTEARRWFDRAVAWMEENKPKDSELVRFRAEAAKLLETQK